MAKVTYHTKQKSVFLSCTETLLLLAGELGTELLDAFLPAKYPEARLSCRLLGLDSFNRNNFHVAKHQLIRRGLVARRGRVCTITSRGATMLDALKAKFEDRRQSWDGKWRVIVFDIPEAQKKYREALRRELTVAGYRRFQDSVWVGKQPLPDDLFTFIEECNLGDYVHLLLVNTVDREDKFGAIFDRE